MSLRIESKKGKKLSRLTVNGNQGTLVKRGGFYVFGKIHLEI